jgi:hypothetical protein
MTGAEAPAGGCAVYWEMGDGAEAHKTHAHERRQLLQYPENVQYKTARGEERCLTTDDERHG